jgi:hypothetical protein
MDNGDSAMDDEANTNEIKMKCPDEQLPTLCGLHSNLTMQEIANVPINARQTLSWSDSAAVEAMKEAITSLAIIPSMRENAFQESVNFLVARLHNVTPDSE